MPKSPKPPSKLKSSDAKARSAAALRENLKRRKAQARLQAQTQAPDALPPRASGDKSAQ